MNDCPDESTEKEELAYSREDRMNNEKQYDGLNRLQLIERIRQLEEENAMLKENLSDENRGPKTIYDIPPEILCKIVEPLGLKDRMRVSRCNRAFRRAVANSKWRLGGPGDLIISCTLEENDDQRFTITFGGDHTIQQTIRSDRRGQADLGRTTFPFMHLWFSKMHLSAIRLRNVPMDPSLLRSFDTFMKDCTFDKLTLWMDKSELFKDKTLDLMAKAKTGIVMMLSKNPPSLTQLRSVARPIKLQVYKKSQVFLSEKALNNLIDNGHSLVGFRADFPSKESLARVVEKVSNSKISQKIDIWSESRISFDECLRFLNMVKATLVPRGKTRLRDYAFNVAPNGGYPSETFQYRGATIYIRRHLGWPHDIRLVVKSKSYASASDQ